jgi:hypothetical protein
MIPRNHDSLHIRISMTYDQPNEKLRFVWRNESFRFRGFGRVRVRNETDGRPMGDGIVRSGGSSCTKALEVGSTRRPRASRSGAQHRVSKDGQKQPTPSLGLGSVPFDKLRAGFRGRPRGASERGLGNSKARKKLRTSALKSLKQLARVNLCATPREGSEADDSR